MSTIQTNSEQSLPQPDVADTPITLRVNLRELWHDVWAVARARWYFRDAAALGPRVRVWGRPVIANHGAMLIGDRARFTSTIVRTQLATGPDGRLEIGERVAINYGCSIGATQLIRIGAGSRLGTYVMMMDNDFHHLEPERRHIRPPSAPIILEDDVWLGARVTVLRGVTIGTGSVVGAGSVVTRDIPPRSLAVGVPARVVKQF